MCRALTGSTVLKRLDPNCTIISEFRGECAGRKEGCWEEMGH